MQGYGTRDFLNVSFIEEINFDLNPSNLLKIQYCFLGVQLYESRMKYFNLPLYPSKRPRYLSQFNKGSIQCVFV